MFHRLFRFSVLPILKENSKDSPFRIFPFLFLFLNIPTPFPLYQNLCQVRTKYLLSTPWSSIKRGSQKSSFSLEFARSGSHRQWECSQLKIAFTKYFRASSQLSRAISPRGSQWVNQIHGKRPSNTTALPWKRHERQPVSQPPCFPILIHEKPWWWPSSVTRRKPQSPVETSLSSGGGSRVFEGEGGCPPISQIMPNPWNTIRTLSAGTWGHGSMDMSPVVYRVERGLVGGARGETPSGGCSGLPGSRWMDAG